MSARELDRLITSYKSGGLINDLVAEFGVHRTTVSAILARAGVTGVNEDSPSSKLNKPQHFIPKGCLLQLSVTSSASSGAIPIAELGELLMAVLLLVTEPTANPALLPALVQTVQVR